MWLISAFAFPAEVAKYIVQPLYLLIFKISSLYLSSVAEQHGLCRTWSETLKTGFYHDTAYVHTDMVARLGA